MDTGSHSSASSAHPQPSGSNTPPGRAQQPSTSGKSFLSTPPNPDDPKTIAAKRVLEAEAQSRYLKPVKVDTDLWLISIDFDRLVSTLGLLEDYREYLNADLDIFAEFAAQMPTIVNGRIYIPREETDKKLLEDHVASWLGKMLSQMFIKLAASDYSECIQPSAVYKCVDRQNRYIDGTTIKPDYILLYPGRATRRPRDVHLIFEAKRESYPDNIQRLHLGQMVDYAIHIWKEQPTRTFVPVFFLNGTQMSLLIFARGDYYRIELGDFFCTSVILRSLDMRSVKDTLIKLWFLLKQSPDRFGHIANVARSSKYLRFGGSKKTATVEAVYITDATFTVIDDNFNSTGSTSKNDCNSTDIITIEETIARSVRIFRRLGHVLRVTYRNNTAILKLIWTPIDGLSEGFVYDVLRYAQVDNIPEVYSSGILLNHFFGYRLEYLLLEDCGDDLMTLAIGHGDPRFSGSKFHPVVMEAIRCTLDTLCQADRFGIFHRDISTGNITFKDGRVRVIDWAYARLTESDIQFVDAHKGKLVRAWGRDVYNAAYLGRVRHSMRGTRYYMSIRVLCQKPERNVLDDIESLLYVALHSLESARVEKATDFLYTDLVPIKAAVCTKASAMCCKKLYREFIRIGTCHKELTRLLDRLYDIVFPRDIPHAPNVLRHQEDDPRELRGDLVRRIVESKPDDIILSAIKHPRSSPTSPVLPLPKAKRRPHISGPILNGGAKSKKHKR